MESYDLRIFKQVAELGSISKAAARLDFVQSNVSQRIKSLEEELGVRLFTRNYRGVVLTPEGNKLLEYTNQILLLMDEARSSINPTTWKSILTIGAPQTISAVRIPQLFATFLKDNNIDVNLRTDRTEKLQEMLSCGELDAIFVNGPYNNQRFESVYTYDEKIVVISPKLNEVKELNKQPLIINRDPHCVYRNKLLDFMKKRNVQNPTVMEFDSLESVVQAVSDGLGMSIIPADVAYSRKELHSIRYEEMPESVRVNVLIKHRKKQSQPLKKFIHFLKETHQIGQ